MQHHFSHRPAPSAKTLVIDRLEAYPNGYCARAFGARVISKPGSELLLVENARTATSVSVSVTSGSC